MSPFKYIIQNSTFSVYKIFIANYFKLLYDELRETASTYFLKIDDITQRKSTRQTAKSLIPTVFPEVKL